MKKGSGIWLPAAAVLAALILFFLILTVCLLGSGAGSKESRTEGTESSKAAGTAGTEERITNAALDDYMVSSGTEVPIPGNQALENPEDYILPESAGKVLTEEDLAGLTAQELTYARNEIYARHGRVFESGELNAYFQGKKWYTADAAFKDAQLSSVEAKNAEFIAQFQNQNNLTYTPK